VTKVQYWAISRYTFCGVYNDVQNNEKHSSYRMDYDACSATENSAHKYSPLYGMK